MHKNVFSTMAATFVIATVALTCPAAATKTSTALSICVSRGPDCTVTNTKGGYQLCVNNTGGKQCVNCPALTEGNKDCTMALTGGGVRNVGAVLRGGSSKMPAKQ
jgi:hypothetical protein